MNLEDLDMEAINKLLSKKGKLTPKEREFAIETAMKLDEMERVANGIKYKQDFYKFNEKVVGWPDIYEPLHKRMCDFVQDNIDKKMCLMLLPRGTFKSSIITVGFSLWMIARDPTTRGLIANATYPMATSFLGQVKKNLEQNEAFIKYYGNLAKGAPVWREDALAVNAMGSYKSKEPTLSAVGVKSNYTGTHFDWAILDDLVNRDNIRTIDRMEEVKNFYRDVLDLVDPSKHGHKKVIIIGTTWHHNDLYSWIMDEEIGLKDQFAILRLPAYGDFDERNRFTGKWGEDELLFPTRLTWDVLENLKISGKDASHFSAQYLLDPVPPEDAEFKNFKYYDPDAMEGIKLNTFMAVDPALSEKKSADYSAIVVVGVDRNNTWYIKDLWRGKVAPKALIDQIFYMDNKHRPVTVAMESVAFQRILQFYLEEEMKRRGHRIPVSELKHTEMSKMERIRGLEPRYAAGQILHPKVPIGHRLHKLENYLRDELERFPKSKNDDLSDALASILEIAYPASSYRRRVKTSYKSNYPA